MKNKNKIKIPKHAFGLDMLGPMAGVMGVAQMATAPGEGEMPSTANTVAGALGGAASGAAAGAALGPIGAIGGALVGGITSIFGANKARKQLEKQRAALAEKKRLEGARVDYNTALANTGQIRADYAAEDEAAYTFANGGMIKNKRKKTFVEERAEIADTKPTNLNFVSKDNMSIKSKDYAYRKVRGDKPNRYYTEGGDYFDDPMGMFTMQNLMNPYMIPNPTYERSNRISAEFYKQNLNKAILEARAENAMLEDIPEYANGGITGSQLAYVDDGEVIRTPDGQTTEVPEQGQPQDSNLVNLPEYSTILSDKLKLKALGGKTPAQYYKSKSAKITTDTGEYAENSAKLNEQNNNKLYNRLLGLQHIENIKLGTKQTSKSIPAYAKGKSGLKFVPGTGSADIKPSSVSFTPSPSLNIPRFTAPSNIPINTSQQAIAIGRGNPQFQTKAQPIYNEGASSGFNLGSINYGALTSLAAPLYNLKKSMEPVSEVAPIENPYTGAILSASDTLSNRRYNIDPAIEANRRTRAMSNFNLDQANLGTGASMAMRTQGAINEYAANADLYATKSNIENQWAGEAAASRMGALSQLGQQQMAAAAQAQQINRQAQAKRDEYGATAATQLGEWGQMQQKYINQARSEDIGWEAMNKFLSQGYTTEEMDRLNALRNKRRFKI